MLGQSKSAEIAEVLKELLPNYYFVLIVEDANNYGEAITNYVPQDCISRLEQTIRNMKTATTKLN